MDKNKSRVLFSSDLHLLHKNICKYTDRNLVTTQELHDQWLIDLWNSQVNKGDLVYVLGDVSFGKIQDTKKLVQQLNGSIIVIKGNHDKREDLDELQDCNLIAKWYEYKEIRPIDKYICMFHFPIACWHKQEYGAWHLFGHSHGNYQQEGLCLDVGIDSSYNVFGKHKLFTYDEVHDIMQSKNFVVNDHRKDNR